MAPPSTSNESNLNAALLKRATERIEELEAQLAAAGGSAAPPDLDALRRLEMQLRDQQTEIAQRVGTMSGAYQQLVSQLRTMSVSLQELAALSTAFSDALDALGSASAEITTAPGSGFSLDVPADRPRPAPTAPAQAPAPDDGNADSALAAAADALLATLADVEASLDEALQDPATAAASARGPETAHAEEQTDEPEVAEAEPEPEADPDPDAAPEKGSRYSRRSAKLPRLGDAAQQEALATARSMRNVFSGD